MKKRLAWRIFATAIMLAVFVDLLTGGIDWMTWLNGFVLGGLLMEWMFFLGRK